MKENNKILKNSFFLYIRLIFSTITGLYVSRLVLAELGAEDFGLYTVVGGIISMMNFLNTTMISTTNRYIAVEIGKKENSNPNKIFNTSFLIHFSLALMIVIFTQTLGVWYVKNHLQMATGKISAALFVLNFTMIAAIFTIMSVPFQGLITAFEKFSVTVTIEILRAILKLILILLLLTYSGDKLRVYSVIIAVVMVIPPILYYLYCLFQYREIVHFKINKRFDDYWDMLKYSGWVVLGVFASLGRGQGAALLLNAFFGTVLNAAFGISSQVRTYIQMFVRNLNQAAVPQIMKSHSGGNYIRSLNLVYSISKYSFFLMLMVSLPILLSLKSILKLWLVDVPEYTYEFTLLMILNGLISSVSTGFDATIHATGKIKASHIYYSITLLSSLPISYIFYYMNYPPYTITIVTIITSIINMTLQINVLTKVSKFKFTQYLNHTLIPAIVVSISLIPLIFLRNMFSYELFDIIIFSTFSSFFAFASIFYLGLTEKEKEIIYIFIRNLKARLF